MINFLTSSSDLAYTCTHTQGLNINAKQAANLFNISLHSSFEYDSPKEQIKHANLREIIIKVVATRRHTIDDDNDTNNKIISVFLHHQVHGRLRSRRATTCTY